MPKLQQTAVVTGASSGIGRAIVQCLLADQYRVVGIDMNTQGLQEIAATADQGSFVAVETDVCDETRVEALRSELQEQGIFARALVNAAGRSGFGSAVDEVSPEDWRDVLAVNLAAPAMMTRLWWPHLIASGDGAIVNIASIAGVQAIPKDVAYCVSKAGLIMLTRCTALDGAPVHVRANCICPGWVETPMIERILEKQPDPASARKRAMSLHPLGRLGRPEEIADTAAFLLSPSSRWTTGAVVAVDGGLTTGIWPGQV